MRILNQMTIYPLLESTNLDPSYPEVWDKSTSSDVTFEHVYPSIVDTHYVSLTATSDSGCFQRMLIQ